MINIRLARCVIFLLVVVCSIADVPLQAAEELLTHDCNSASGDCSYGDSDKRELQQDILGLLLGQKQSNLRIRPSVASPISANALTAPIHGVADAANSAATSLGLPSLDRFFIPLSQFKPQPDVDAALYPVAQENFRRWNEALKSKDYIRVASMYSSTDLSFLPTVSPDFIRDSQSTEKYFIEFLKKHPVGTVTADKVQSFGKDAYLHTGMYTFEVGSNDKRSSVDARFSYMWRKFGEEWKIVHHHSSALPGGNAGSTQQARNEKMYPVAQANFKVWNDALQTGDYALVASLYSTSDLSFLPTVSNDFVRDSPSTQAYFMEFLKKLPFGTITADKVQSFCDGSYLHSGMYTFSVGPSNAREQVEARFSYMWALIDKQWQIVHHHSSVRPAK